VAEMKRSSREREGTKFHSSARTSSAEVSLLPPPFLFLLSVKKMRMRKGDKRIKRRK
jgi:hypothetical protein